MEICRKIPVSRGDYDILRKIKDNVISKHYEDERSAIDYVKDVCHTDFHGAKYIIKDWLEQDKENERYLEFTVRSSDFDQVGELYWSVKQLIRNRKKEMRHVQVLGLHSRKHYSE